jgi:hypothetical protein
MRPHTVRLVATLTLALVVAPSAADAQGLTTAHRIGWLSVASPPTGPNPSLEAFRQGLRDLGQPR